MISRKAPWTINELIAALIAIRAEHGNLGVRMSDGEPVVFAAVHEESVVISDRDGAEEAEQAAADAVREVNMKAIDEGRPVGERWSEKATDGEMEQIHAFAKVFLAPHEECEVDETFYQPDPGELLYRQIHPDGDFNSAFAFWSGLGVSDQQQASRWFIGGFCDGAINAWMKRTGRMKPRADPFA
jgi:hypothetical protein